MFIGRERELATLDRLYATQGFQFPVIYGRRRVGKTSLIAEFTKDRPTIFFTAVEDSAPINLRNLSREIHQFEHPGDDPLTAPVYPDFQTAFEAVFNLARSRRLVFVIDEFPYLAKAEPSVSSILQALIDREKDSSQLLLILCGSSLSFMREQVLDQQSPLYGRRTAQIELKPFDFFDAMRFFPGAGAVEVAEYYGMAGGVPLYLMQFDAGLSVRENVERVFLEPSSILFEEPQNLLKQEVQKSATYNAVIGAIAEGRTTANQIAGALGTSTAETAYYLKELQRIGLVEREVPVLNPGRRAVYRLSDNLFRFWYRFVLPNRSTIERGMTSRALAQIEGRLPEYMGPVFEQICGQWLWRRNADGMLGEGFDVLGRWWGNDPVLRREEEIDIVCLDGRRPAIVGECKWRNEAVDVSVVETLKRRLGLVGGDGRTERYLFSKGGFTEGCAEAADDDAHLHLVTLGDMAQIF